MTWVELTVVLSACVDIDDVNKAFAEMHEEVEHKVYRTDFDSAMN